MDNNYDKEHLTLAEDLAFIFDNTLGTYCPMDEDAFCESLKLASSSCTTDPYRTFSTPKMDFLLDNFAMVIVTLALDSEFRSVLIKALENERSLYMYSEDHLYQVLNDIGYRPDEDHITIDVDRCDCTTPDVVISRIANSYSKLMRSDALDAVLYDLDPEDAKEVGYVGSSFMPFIAALEHSDELFGILQDVVNACYRVQEKYS